MDLIARFDGRIGRKDFWRGAIVLALILFCAGVVAFFALGQTRLYTYVNLLFFLIIAIPASALVTKRLHDRDKPAMPWLLLFVGIPIAGSILQVLGIGYAITEIDNRLVIEPDTLGWTISILMAVVSFWAFVELALLKGTEGPNRFGPDPLA